MRYPNVKPEDVVKVGDEIETYVIRVNDVEGYAILSKKRLDAVKVWEDIETAGEDKTVLEGTVTEVNKGGIVVSSRACACSCPLPRRQAQGRRSWPDGQAVGQAPGDRGQPCPPPGRRFHQSVLYEERQAAQAAIWESIEVGKHYDGVVKSMTSYGVFVDIGGVDGMVHISELSWSRIKNPAEVVSVGDHLGRVRYLLRPREAQDLSRRQGSHPEPLDVFMNTYKVGDVANVRIVKLMTFGAFAEVVPGVDGLIAHLPNCGPPHREAR